MIRKYILVEKLIQLFFYLYLIVLFLEKNKIINFNFIFFLTI